MGVRSLPIFKLNSDAVYDIEELKGASLVTVKLEGTAQDLFGSITADGNEEVILNPLNGRLRFLTSNISPGQKCEVIYSK